MNSPLASIIALTAAPRRDKNEPGTGDERARLEWTWNIGHNRLEQHLQEFRTSRFRFCATVTADQNIADPERLLTDDDLAVLPDRDNILRLLLRNTTANFGLRRPSVRKVYNGCTAFEYVVLPIDPTDSRPSRMLVSNVPPHLVLCATSGKIHKAWGHLRGKDFDAQCASLVRRANGVVPQDRPRFGMREMNMMRNMYRLWSWIDYVPPSFLSEDSDQTNFEAEETSTPLYPIVDKAGVKRNVGNSRSSSPEPKRRLYPSELQHDPYTRLCSSTSSDDTLSSYSSIVEESEGVYMDCEMGRTWVKGIESWAEETTAAAECDERTLLNDSQIPEDPKEQPRVLTKLEMEKPDYLREEPRRRVAD
ncbi:hypothetical protein GGX14DRAFT_571628 [Mycena pura]|uniref:Uncharacterized protein n=1 Tax=Mycena pura TaxID=153505 RepID=A0AAD6V6D8_9AGAR|nr:hypothetical protein GGX14DRAFT_571628 [Mycena pura]